MCVWVGNCLPGVRSLEMTRRTNDRIASVGAERRVVEKDASGSFVGGTDEVEFLGRAGGEVETSSVRQRLGEVFVRVVGQATNGEWRDAESRIPCHAFGAFAARKQNQFRYS